MKDALTQTEQKILEMLKAMDIITDEMNALVPALVESRELDKWNELYNYREDLYVDCYKTVESYIKEKAVQEDAQECWKEVAATNINCTKALDTVIQLQKEKRISKEEYDIISKPLNRELQNLQRFAVSMIFEKKKELDLPADNSNPLNFIA